MQFCCMLDLRNMTQGPDPVETDISRLVIDDDRRYRRWLRDLYFILHTDRLDVQRPDTFYRHFVGCAYGAVVGEESKCPLQEQASRSIASGGLKWEVN